jgi:hypothetical protein
VCLHENASKRATRVKGQRVRVENVCDFKKLLIVIDYDFLLHTQTERPPKAALSFVYQLSCSWKENREKFHCWRYFRSIVFRGMLQEMNETRVRAREIALQMRKIPSLSFRGDIYWNFSFHVVGDRLILGGGACAALMEFWNKQDNSRDISITVFFDKKIMKFPPRHFNKKKLFLLK